MKLGKRLQAIFDMVPNSVVADVGADHGKLIISLFEQGKISHGYAIENKAGPYNTLVKALKDRNLEEDIVPLFSDGISDLPDIVSTIVIAGMGANTIANILLKNPNKLKKVNCIIIDAHTNIPYIREKICQLGFTISDEKIVEEFGIYYEIIKFIKSDSAYFSNKDLEFGPILSKEKSDVFKAKYHKRIVEIDHLLKKKLPNDKMVKLLKEKERIASVL